MIGSVYVGTSLRNADRALQIMGYLEQENIQIAYNWTTHGQVYSDEDLERVAIAEEQGVKDCQVFLMIFPGRNGTHTELGLARGLGKHIVLLEDVEVEQTSFYRLPGIKRFEKQTEAIQHIVQYFSELRDA